MDKVECKIHAKYWLNIPSSDVKTVFELDSNQFQQQFELVKPRKDDKIIVFCKPTTDEANQLEALGYTNVKYSDGWVDWNGLESEFDSEALKNWRSKVWDSLIMIPYIIIMGSIVLPFLLMSFFMITFIIVIALNVAVHEFREFSK